jgi:hypothetical protein
MKTGSAHCSNRHYDSNDLNTLENLTDDVLAALVRADRYPLEPGVSEVLRQRIAATLFEFADKEDDLDVIALKRRVLEQFLIPIGQ